MWRSANPCVAISMVLPEVSPGRSDGNGKTCVVLPLLAEIECPERNSWPPASATSSMNCTDPSAFEYSSFIVQRWNAAWTFAAARPRTRAARRMIFVISSSPGNCDWLPAHRRRRAERLARDVLHLLHAGRDTGDVVAEGAVVGIAEREGGAAVRDRRHPGGI